jgi:hypothetical protein
MDAMTPPNLTPSFVPVPSVLVPLVVAAVAMLLLVVATRPAAPTIVVVEPPAAHVSPATFMQPAWCAGYNWRMSSIDLRPWCGWR